MSRGLARILLFRYGRGQGEQLDDALGKAVAIDLEVLCAPMSHDLKKKGHRPLSHAANLCGIERQCA